MAGLGGAAARVVDQERGGAAAAAQMDQRHGTQHSQLSWEGCPCGIVKSAQPRAVRCGAHAVQAAQSAVHSPLAVALLMHAINRRWI